MKEGKLKQQPEQVLFSRDAPKTITFSGFLLRQPVWVFESAPKHQAS